MQKIKIITRNSILALWQANYVKELLVAIYPNLKIEVMEIVTQGDKLLDISLDKIGGKGLFIKELECALLDKSADMAVHSLKDVSANLESDFELSTILKRGLASDALISNKYDSLENMPDGSIIGTSSARRIALLKKYYPHIQTKLLRGNLTTRLKKLDNNEYDGIILASIGLIRLGMEHRICQYLDVNKFIPAIGQGALAIEILKTRDDLRELLEPLNDEQSTLEVACEREVGRLFGANCSTPLGVHAKLLENKIYLNAIYFNLDSNKCYESSIVASKNEYLQASIKCVDNLTS